VRALDGVDRVAEVAGHAAVLGVELGQVQAVLREPLGEGDRRVAAHAEVADRAVRFALRPRVHRDEDGVLGGVGVHRARPLAVAAGVTPGAALRVHELLARKRRLGLGRRGRGLGGAGGEQGEARGGDDEGP
jgi:hypothetical protein